MPVGSVQRASGGAWGTCLCLGVVGRYTCGKVPQRGRFERGDGEDLWAGRHGWVGKWCEEKHIRQREECIEYKKQGDTRKCMSSG